MKKNNKGHHVGSSTPSTGTTGSASTLCPSYSLGVESLDDGEKGTTLIRTPGGHQEVVIVNSTARWSGHSWTTPASRGGWQRMCARYWGSASNRDALLSLDDGERGSVKLDTLGGPQEMAAVNEPGLYRLIMRSRKSRAVCTSLMTGV